MRPDPEPATPIDRFAAVVFDMDGVLILSEPLHLRAKREAFAAFGLDVPESLYSTFYGRTDLDVIGEVVARFGPHLDTQQVIRRKQAAYTALAQRELELVPGALEVLDAVRKRPVRRALVTSASPSNQRLAFARFDLAPYFDLVLTAADVERHKPDPEPYATALARLGVDGARTLVVEDAPNGVRSARGAGCVVVGLATSFSSEALEAAGARDIFKDMFGLGRWLLGDAVEASGSGERGNSTLR